jgi:hypothetical protein
MAVTLALPNGWLFDTRQQRIFGLAAWGDD